jgi:hypothetical protein
MLVAIFSILIIVNSVKNLKTMIIPRVRDTKSCVNPNNRTSDRINRLSVNFLPYRGKLAHH